MTDDFRHRTPLQVRFRDIDAFGHVNNAVFFSYVEMARIKYLLDVLEVEADFSTLPLILARVELDFRSPSSSTTSWRWPRAWTASAARASR